MKHMSRFTSISALLQAALCLMTVTRVIIFAVHAMRAHDNQGEAERIPAIVDISNDLFAAIQGFRLERGAVTHALDIAAPGDNSDAAEIETQRAAADKALDSALTKLATVRVSGAQPIIKDINESRNQLIALRRETATALARPEDPHPAALSANWIAASFKLVTAINGLSTRLDNEFNERDPSIPGCRGLRRLRGPWRKVSGQARLPSAPS